jgi:DnaJ-class molecular chaperone
MVNAPYGVCEEHNVPLELLFQIPYCPVCEGVPSLKDCNSEGCDECEGYGAGYLDADVADCDDCGGWGQMVFPWA